MVNDLSESQLISLIKDKDFKSMVLWLKVHHPKYTKNLSGIPTSIPIDPEAKKASDKAIEEFIEQCKTCQVCLKKMSDQENIVVTAPNSQVYIPIQNN